MKKLFLVLIAVVVIATGAFAQSTRNVAVSMTVAETMNLTLSATTVDFGVIPVPDNQRIWSANINATAVLNVGPGNVAVNISQAAELTSGSNHAGFCWSRGTGDFLYTERAITAAPAQVVLWTSPADSTKTGTVALAYNNENQRPVGTYTATVTYTLVKI